MLGGDIKINKEDIIIFHTHTCESYTPSENYMYETNGTYRTTDLNFSVARVGDELTNQLKAYGYNVSHDTTYHDYPAYSGSYGRSLETVSAMINNNSQTVIDIHRDAIGSKSDYAPKVKIGEDITAQLMFVIGTNGGGAEHTNWVENLKYAVKLQEKANELYPGLFKPLILRNSRYNQHLTTASTIIEVGATGNTLDECLNSMKYLAKVIDEL
ncbi:MAG: stage II sporulation protein P [Clostridia bacterium]|nr:stage II sporulation protein P [Clostridia bacterium]